jgi:hypothetical protein
VILLAQRAGDVVGGTDRACLGDQVQWQFSIVHRGCAVPATFGIIPANRLREKHQRRRRQRRWLRLLDRCRLAPGRT